MKTKRRNNMSTLLELGALWLGMKASNLIDANIALKNEQTIAAHLQNENMMLRNYIAQMEAQKMIESQPTTTYEEIEAEYQRSIGN
jgi:hypothetical protein